MAGYKRIRKAYRFFCKAEPEQKEFSAEDIANATGWKIGTVKSYITKKWHFILKSSNAPNRKEKHICLDSAAIPGLINIAERVYPSRKKLHLPSR
jgi:hypothetical protein